MTIPEHHRPVLVRDVIRLEEGSKEFMGCLAIVTEVCVWGVKADVLGPATTGLTGPLVYPVRAEWDTFVVVGSDWRGT